MKYFKQKTKLGVCTALAAAITACGGGGGGNSNGTTVSRASDTTVRTYLASSNTSNTNFPWNDLAYSSCDGKTKRWTLPIQVRAPYISTRPRAIAAMDTIESKLGYTLFDRTNLTTTPGGGFVGIVFSDSGHSYVPFGQIGSASYQANVSAGPDLPNFPSPTLNGSCEISTALYINLDNSVFTVTNPDIVVHEFGHALGLGSHFTDFGNGAAISADFWDVLGTLYGVPAGTSAATVPVVRVN